MPDFTAGNTQLFVHNGRWAAYTSFVSGGAGETSLTFPNPLTETAEFYIVDGLSVLYIAAAGNVCRPLIYPRYGQTITIYFDRLTSPATGQVEKVWSALHIPIEKNTGTDIFACTVTAMALAERVSICLWGTYEQTVLDQPIMQPVSLEGYKWPLARR